MLVQSSDNNNKINVGYKIFDFFSLLIISRKLVMYLAIFAKPFNPCIRFVKDAIVILPFPSWPSYPRKGYPCFFEVIAKLI